MIVTSNLGGPGHRPPRPLAGRLLAAVHVQWSRNYPVAGASRAFSYSIVWVCLPGPTAPPIELTEQLEFGFTSVCVAPDDDRRDVVTNAAADLHEARTGADVIAGHQLGSQLDILAASSVPDHLPVTDGTIDAWLPGGVGKVRTMWRRRANNTAPRTIDTRFDLDGDAARRPLVDVCATLGLDIAEPELDDTPIATLHRAWLDQHDLRAHRRLTMHGLRQSLSIALVALHAIGAATRSSASRRATSASVRAESAWTRLKVNDVLAQLYDSHGAIHWRFVSWKAAPGATDLADIRGWPGPPAEEAPTP